MYILSKNVGSVLAVASVAVLAGAFAWISYPSLPNVVRDYEECANEAHTNIASAAEYSQQITDCSARFAGRRKVGGGYTYFDFMQNRSFDIAGPNPTADERKQIDFSYMEFIRAQRQDILSSDLAKTKADQEQAAFERSHEDVHQPLTLIPKIPLPVKRPPIQALKVCEDGSLACSLAKLSATVRNAFASANANR
jgi:hypothetical protein